MKTFYIYSRNTDTTKRFDIATHEGVNNWDEAIAKANRLKASMQGNQTARTVYIVGHSFIPVFTV